jgi:hypothetical protein
MKESERVLAQLLDECAELLLAGESIAGCLARYPEHAARLAPLLQSVSAVRSYSRVPPRNLAVAARSRAQFITAVGTLPAASPAAGRSGLAAWWARALSGFQVLRPLPAGLALALVCVVVMGMLTTGVITVSATALPGDAFYGVKLATEQARLLLAPDAEARAAIDQQILNNRIAEARAIRDMHRAVAQMPLAGRLEQMGPTGWVISGLPVQINAHTTIVGTPAVGAMVRGSVQAPGDGTLVALYLQVEGPAGAAVPAAVPATATPVPTVTATATVRVVQANPTLPPAPSRITGAPAKAVSLTRERFPSRTAAPQASATPLVVLFPTATPKRATATAAPVSTAAPVVPSPMPTIPPTRVPARIATVFVTAAPTPRVEQKQALRDAFVSMARGNQWVIGGVAMDSDANTQIIGTPAVGDIADVDMLVREGKPNLALVISLKSRAPTPIPAEFGDFITAQTVDIWTIGDRLVRLMPDTVVTGNPQVGDWVSCKGDAVPGGVRGRTIQKVTLAVVEFTGMIEAMSGNQWQVRGQNLYLPATVLLSGAPPRLGRTADVRAEQAPDGRLRALAIYVHPDTPTPSPVPPTRIATSTPVPTSTDTPTPTNTPAPPASVVAPAASPGPEITS